MAPPAQPPRGLAAAAAAPPGGPEEEDGDEAFIGGEDFGEEVADLGPEDLQVRRRVGETSMPRQSPES